MRRPGKGRDRQQSAVAITEDGEQYGEGRQTPNDSGQRYSRAEQSRAELTKQGPCD